MRPSRWKLWGFLAVLLLITSVWTFKVYGRPLWMPVYLKIVGVRTVRDVLKTYGPDAENRLKTYFKKAAVGYPPKKIALIGLKKEGLLELWARGNREWKLVKTYGILGASGESGPKLKQGDLQVPEGVYSILWLNPNSSYHLSMKINYPNGFDRRKANAEKRTNLGGDIFIHGYDVSIGCIAIGNPGIEELFVLAANIGRGNVKVLISPNDLRRSKPITDMKKTPAWLPELYEKLTRELAAFK